MMLTMRQFASTESITDLLSRLEIISCSKGFQNTVIRAILDDEAVFVKIYGEPENFDNESLVLLQLEKDNFVFPRLRAHHRNLLANILSCVPGRPLTKDDCDNGAFDQFVVSLRSLHGFRGLHKRNGIQREMIDLYVRKICESIHVKEEEKKLVSEVAGSVRTTLLTVHGNGFIHGDLNANNILYSPESREIGYIDFERARVDHPFADLAKFSWRVLDNESDIVRMLLVKYLQRKPDKKEVTLLNAYMALEFLGAVSYYAYEGHANNYPYKDQAIHNLALWPLLK